MDTEAFGRVLDAAQDSDKPLDVAVVDHLSALPAEEILAFEHRFSRVRDAVYRASALGFADQAPRQACELLEHAVQLPLGEGPVPALVPPAVKRRRWGACWEQTGAAGTKTTNTGSWRRPWRHVPPPTASRR
ncbi:DUF4240 domain-containing protein [Streptomyces cyaneochromogenes]|uniref:DUF4240 domain-containing protein n=1 Tax=Streptomyces cyaneochromogenes TaxID=2496836 RepID=UPI00389B1B7F